MGREGRAAGAPPPPAGWGDPAGQSPAQPPAIRLGDGMRGRENKWERAPCLSGRLGASGPQTTRGSARGCLRAACAAWTATERAAEPGHHGRGFSAWAGGRSPLGHVPASGLWEGHGSSEVALDQRASRPVPLPASPQLCLAGPPCPARGAPRQACPSAGARALGRSPRSAVSGEQCFLRAPSRRSQPQRTAAPRGVCARGPPGPHTGPPDPPGAAHGAPRAAHRARRARRRGAGPTPPGVASGVPATAAGEMAGKGPVSWACQGGPGCTGSQQSGALPRTSLRR